VNLLHTNKSAAPPIHGNVELYELYMWIMIRLLF